MSNLISSEEEKNKDEGISPLTGMEIPVRDWQAEIKRWSKKKRREIRERNKITLLVLVHYLIYININWEISFLLSLVLSPYCFITLLNIISSLFCYLDTAGVIHCSSTDLEVCSKRTEQKHLNSLMKSRCHFQHCWDCSLRQNFAHETNHKGWRNH